MVSRRPCWWQHYAARHQDFWSAMRVFGSKAFWQLWGTTCRRVDWQNDLRKRYPTDCFAMAGNIREPGTLMYNRWCMHLVPRCVAPRIWRVLAWFFRDIPLFQRHLMPRKCCRLAQQSLHHRKKYERNWYIAWGQYNKKRIKEWKRGKDTLRETKTEEVTLRLSRYESNSPLWIEQYVYIDRFPVKTSAAQRQPNCMEN